MLNNHPGTITQNNLKTLITMKRTYYIPQTDLICLSGSPLLEHAVSGTDLPPEPAPARRPIPGNMKMQN